MSPAANKTSNDGSDDKMVVSVASIVAAYASNNTVSTADLPGLIKSVHDALKGISTDAVQPQAPADKPPAVSVKKSITDDHLICLEDGKRFKSLKRHLRTQYGLSPEQYRRKWNLPADYPMVAPNYAAARSQLAHRHGLGKSNTRGQQKSQT